MELRGVEKEIKEVTAMINHIQRCNKTRIVGIHKQYGYFGTRSK